MNKWLTNDCDKNTHLIGNFKANSLDIEIFVQLLGVGREYPLPTGKGWKFFLEFWVENGAFWCILDAIYADYSNLKLYAAHQR